MSIVAKEDLVGKSKMDIRSQKRGIDGEICCQKVIVVIDVRVSVYHMILLLDMYTFIIHRFSKIYCCISMRIGIVP